MDDSSPVTQSVRRDREQAFRERLALREAQSAETAWELGTRDAEEEKTPLGAYDVEDRESYPDYVFDSPDARGELARLLGLEEGADDPATGTAACAYADAYELVVGTGKDTVPTGLPYKAGQEVTTARGRHGYVTRNSTRSGHPVIEFDGGARSAVPRSAIPGPLAFQVDDHEAAARAAAGSRVLQVGDVLLVGPRPDALIQAGNGVGLLPPSAWGSIDQGQYAASIRLAQKFTDIVVPVEPAASRGPESSRPPAAHRARPTARLGREAGTVHRRKVG